MDLAAVPFLNGEPIESIVVFVIAVDKERSKVTLLVSLDYVLVRFVLTPDASEITSYDDIVVLREVLLLRKVCCIQFVPVVVTVRVACYKNTCHIFTS